MPGREPADDPEQPDDFGRAVGQHLIDVHDHLRGELARLQDLVGQLRGGTVDPGQVRGFVNQMTIRQNSWTVGAYCASYCRLLTGHHSLEDEGIFPHLRASEPVLGPVLDRLAEEHVAIHGVLERVDRAFVAFLAHPAVLDEVETAIDELDSSLLTHLAYEESQLVEPLGRHGFYAGQIG
ncbi:MAG TPA: hemerythrin domain-containing protein [Mycobacteriales bacterium]|jgi:hypothetical protein|nr:hemerythrin domain-containing protein [Mycobacteriales bacterium]